MKIYDFQPLALQTYPRQPGGEVCPDVPPTTPSFFIPRSAAHESLPLSHPTLPFQVIGQRTIAFPPASPQFKTHSAGGIEAV
jgi:hypothetical protein